MKSDWRDAVKGLAANACAVLQEHYGLDYVAGSLQVRCAKMWEFYSQARGERARPAQALAEFAYCRALDSLTLAELAPTLRVSDENSALATVFDAVERFVAAAGDRANARAAGQEAATLAQALRIHAQDVRDPDERTRLNNAAEVWGRVAPLMVELYSLRREVPVVGCLLPPGRIEMEPETLLGLQERERARALNRDLVRLQGAGVPESQLAQVWYGEDTPQNRKHVKDRLRHAAANGRKEIPSAPDQ